MSAVLDLINTDRHRLAIERGATYTKILRVKDPDTGEYLNLTTYGLSLKILDSDDVLVLEASTANGRITVSTVTATLTIAAVDTDDLTAGVDYHHTFDLTAGSVVRRFASGAVEIV